MNFKDLLLNLVEQSRARTDSFRTTGEAVKKERAVSGAPDKKAKDAARKRVERARQVPRSQKPKDQLVKEVIPVQTASGSVQLIFKDSFDKQKHRKISKTDTLSLEDAKSYTKDPKFEQTGASKLLFGELKAREKEEKEQKGQEKSREEEAKEVEKKSEEEKEKATVSGQKKQAKRMSKEDVFAAMSQMSPEQLAQVPFEVKQEYFMQTRKPPTNTAFDSLTFEKLSTLFGINTLTSTPYNQQVINALIFLAKVKAGATEQEIQSYAAMSPNAFDFTKIAFGQARKILSQMGDQCIQTLVSSVESGTQSTMAEGNVDMQCGDYKFKISAGGEFLLTTDSFDQKSKTFRGMLTNALNQTLANPEIKNDPKVKAFADGVQKVGLNFSNALMSNETFEIAKKNPELMAQLQNTPLVDSTGKQNGMMVDAKGNLNKLASFENYQSMVGKQASNLFKGSAKAVSDFSNVFIQNILKMYYRGDGIRPQENSPSHLVTQNGIFPMSDDYFAEVAKSATISLKPVKAITNTDNIDKTQKSSELFNRYVTMVEEAKPKEQKMTLDKLFIQKDSIDPLQLALAQAGRNMDFDINVSLLPGFSPKDLNIVQYNYVRIGKKTIKIPVEKTELVALELQENTTMILNDLFVEGLTNNFVLSKLVKSGLLTDSEAFAVTSPSVLNEDSNLMKIIYNNLVERANENPKLLLYILNSYNSELYEKYVRDYKMEYRNYHGKPKQRKERAKRTKAREDLIKKGKVKKGDGKDVDHKKALRHGGSNGINNLRIRDRSENRADNGHKKGEKQSKDWK